MSPQEGVSKKMAVATLALVLLGVLPTLCSATSTVEYFIDCQNGSDSNNGLTANAAFRSIAYAVITVVPPSCPGSVDVTLTLLVPTAANAPTAGQPLCGPDEVADMVRFDCANVKLRTLAKDDASTPSSVLVTTPSILAVNTALAFDNVLTTTNIIQRGPMADGTVPTAPYGSFGGATFTVGGGDGSSDFATIDAALASGSVVDGSKLVVAGGVYTVTTTITVTKRVWIQGGGNVGGATTTLQGVGVATVFDIQVPGVAITDLVIVQPAAMQSDRCVSLAAVPTSRHFYLADVTLDTGGVGINVWDGDGVTLRRVNFVDSGSGSDPVVFVQLVSLVGVFNMMDIIGTVTSQTTVVEMPSGSYVGLVRIYGVTLSNGPQYFYHHTGWMGDVKKLNLEIGNVSANGGGGVVLDTGDSGVSPLDAYATIVLKNYNYANADSHGAIALMGTNTPVIAPGSVDLYVLDVTMNDNSLASGWAMPGGMVTPYVGYDTTAFSAPTLTTRTLPLAAVRVINGSGAFSMNRWGILENGVEWMDTPLAYGVYITNDGGETLYSIDFVASAIGSIYIDTLSAGSFDANAQLTFTNTVLGGADPTETQSAGGICNGRRRSQISSANVPVSFISSSVAARHHTDWLAPVMTRNGCDLTVSCSTGCTATLDATQNTADTPAMMFRGPVTFYGNTSPTINTTLRGGKMQFLRSLTVSGASVTMDNVDLLLSPTASDYSMLTTFETCALCVDSVVSLSSVGTTKARLVVLGALNKSPNVQVHAIRVRYNNLSSPTSMRLPFTSLTVDPSVVASLDSIVKMDAATTKNVALVLTQSGGTLSLPHGGYRWALEEKMIHSPRAAVGIITQGTVLYDFDASEAVTLHVSPSVAGAHSGSPSTTRQRMFEVVSQLPSPYDGSVDGQVWIRDDVWGATYGCDNDATAQPTYQNAMPDCGQKAGLCIASNDAYMPTDAFACATSPTTDVGYTTTITAEGDVTIVVPLSTGLVQGTTTPVRGTCAQPAANYTMGADCTYQLGAGESVVVAFLGSNTVAPTQTDIDTLFANDTMPTSSQLAALYGNCAMSFSVGQTPFAQWWSPTAANTGDLRTVFASNALGSVFSFTTTPTSINATVTTSAAPSAWATCVDGVGAPAFASDMTTNVLVQKVRPRYPLGFRSALQSAGLPAAKYVLETSTTANNNNNGGGGGGGGGTRDHVFIGGELCVMSMLGDPTLVVQQTVTFIFPTYSGDATPLAIDITATFADGGSAPHPPTTFADGTPTECQYSSIDDYPSWGAGGAVGVCRFAATLVWQIPSVSNLRNQTLTGSVGFNSVVLSDATNAVLAELTNVDAYTFDASFAGQVAPVYSRVVFVDFSKPTLAQPTNGQVAAATLYYTVTLTVPVTDGATPLAQQVWDVGNTKARYENFDELGVVLTQTAESLPCTAQLPASLVGQNDAFTGLPYVGMCGVRLTLVLSAPAVDSDNIAWQGTLALSEVIVSQVSPANGAALLSIDTLTHPSVDLPTPSYVGVNITLPYGGGSDSGGSGDATGGRAPLFISRPTLTSTTNVTMAGCLTQFAAQTLAAFESQCVPVGERSEFTVSLLQWVNEKVAQPVTIRLDGVAVCIPLDQRNIFIDYVGGDDGKLTASGGCFDMTVASDYTPLYGDIFNRPLAEGWDVVVRVEATSLTVSFVNQLIGGNKTLEHLNLIVNFVVTVVPTNNMDTLAFTSRQASTAADIAIAKQRLSTPGRLTVVNTPSPVPTPTDGGANGVYVFTTAYILRVVLSVGIVALLLLVFVYVAIFVSARGCTLLRCCRRRSRRSSPLPRSGSSSVNGAVVWETNKSSLYALIHKQQMH